MLKTNGASLAAAKTASGVATPPFTIFSNFGALFLYLFTLTVQSAYVSYRVK